MMLRCCDRSFRRGRDCNCTVVAIWIGELGIHCHDARLAGVSPASESPSGSTGFAVTQVIRYLQLGSCILDGALAQ